MQSNTSKIVLAVIITAIIVGGGVYYWQSSKQSKSDIIAQSPSIQPNLEIYSSEKYSFQYPKGYSIIPADASFKVLTLKRTDNIKLEIFQMKDFGDRPWGFSGEETQEDIDGYVPKEQLTVGAGDKKYDVWLYYNENDKQAKEELKTIFDSVVVK